MGPLAQDLRYSLRTLRRNPVFAVVSIATLALGIGAATAIFSVVYGVLLRPLPYPRPDRIVSVSEVGGHGERMRLSDPNFADLRAGNHTLQGLAEYASWTDTIVPGGASATAAPEPARVTVARVSSDFFAVMGVSPALGRGFVEAERRPGAASSVLVSDRFWRQALGAEPRLDGLTLRAGTTIAPVVGVMPPGFRFPGDADIWLPREIDEALPSRTAHNWRAVGRLKDGTTLDQARADAGVIARRLKEQEKDDTDMVDAAVVPLRDALTGGVRTALLVVLAAVGSLLLVAWANVVNLSLAHAAARRRELAIRSALGAGRLRLLRQFLTEALVLSLAGGALGAFLASWGVDLLLALAPASLPRAAEVGVHLPVLLFTLGLSALVAAGLGTLTAFRATSGGRQDALVEAGRGQVTTRTSQRLGRAISAAEIGVTLVLLVGAGLLGRSLLRVLSVDPGFRTDRIVTLEIALPWVEDDTSKARRIAFLDDLLARLGSLPGVREVGGSGALPLAGGLADGTFAAIGPEEAPQTIEGFTALFRDRARTGHADYCVAGAGYFRALGIPLLRGRMFDARDVLDAPHVALISESLARLRWPGEDPLGRTIEFGNMDGDLRLLTIVGIVRDVRHETLEAPPAPTIYVDYRQRPQKATDLAIVMQAAGSPDGIAAAAREVVRRMDPLLAPRVRSFEEIYAASIGSRRFNLTLIGVFAAAALLLAVAGIYGVFAYSVARRTREIGVRMALGARSDDIFRMVLGQGLSTGAAGIAAGVAGALALTRTMASLLFGVTPTDPVTFLGVAGLLLAVSLLACCVPARRATRVHPMEALRYD